MSVRTEPAIPDHDVARPIELPIELADESFQQLQRQTLSGLAVCRSGEPLAAQMGQVRQGTVQTAVQSGTPVVGVAMQAEQQANTDNVVARGAGFRIARRFWKADAIRRALATILDDARYNTNAEALARKFARADGRAGAAHAMWGLIDPMRSINVA